MALRSKTRKYNFFTYFSMSLDLYSKPSKTLHAEVLWSEVALPRPGGHFKKFFSNKGGAWCNICLYARTLYCFFVIFVAEFMPPATTLGRRHMWWTHCESGESWQLSGHSAPWGRLEERIWWGKGRRPLLEKIFLSPRRWPSDEPKQWGRFSLPPKGRKLETFMCPTMPPREEDLAIISSKYW